MVKEFRVSTEGGGDMVDITSEVSEVLRESGVAEGTILVFVLGSTAAISATEYEEGVKKDIKGVLEAIAPAGADYEHHKKWGDNNGDAHIKATLIGPDLKAVISGRELMLGTWQQIVLLDFDERPRERRVIVKIIEG